MITLKQKLATALVATGLMVGAVPAATLASAEHAAAATVLPKHGAWRGIAASERGESGFGVVTDMNDGGTTALIDKGDEVSLVLTDPKWNLKVGQHAPVHVDIDGETYTGDAVATDTDAVTVPKLSSDVVLKFAGASQMVVNVGNGSIVWTVGLRGFSASLSDAARAYKASY